MREGQIITTICTSVGSSFNFGPDVDPVVIHGDELCVRCLEKGKHTPADYLVVGTVESFRADHKFLCRTCTHSFRVSLQHLFQGLGVKDKPPADSFHRWVVDEYTYGDSHKRFFISTMSYQEALGFYRAAKNFAAQYGGLYPDLGVQEQSFYIATKTKQSYQSDSSLIGIDPRNLNLEN